MTAIQVNFEPAMDDPSNPHERVLAFHNGLSELEPSSNYEGGLIRIRLLPNQHLEVELYLLPEGVTVRTPRENLASELAVRAN